MTSINTIASFLRDIVRERVLQGAAALKIVAVLDIEGTTTALPFVTKVLFPYAESHLDQFVTEKLNKIEHSEPGLDEPDEALFRTILALAEGECGDKLSGETFCALIREKMAINSKITYLKLLQGMIWHDGYGNGALKGHVFKDVPAFLESFTTIVSEVCFEGSPLTISGSAEIYSSGSISAQKLLFGNSTHGDMCPYLSGYHDPASAGPKTESSSYRNIRENIDSRFQAQVGQNKDSMKPILVFFTDSVAEATACATSAAFDMCVFVRRPLNNIVSECECAELKRSGIESISSFVQFGTALKLALDPELAGDIEQVSDHKLSHELEDQVSEFRHAGDLKLFQ